ncbi:SidA/IucD/PvdA family monooxygenase [Streptomyces rishiriensis]|uniref:SidA/IucD/PvdA family monooxygenase n=1 Tax=Streptomyces rishiriensis TaxID=68264 RepID=UPI0037A3BA50
MAPRPAGRRGQGAGPLPGRPRLPGRAAHDITVLGSGQSGAEIFLDLRRHTRPEASAPTGPP